MIALDGRYRPHSPKALARGPAVSHSNAPQHGPAPRRVTRIAALADAGCADRLLLGGDTVASSARSTADGSGMSFLLNGLRPRIEREGVDIATAIFVDNPARAFAATWCR